MSTEIKEELNRRKKKKFVMALSSVAVVTSLLAVAKLTDFSVPMEKLKKLAQEKDAEISYVAEESASNASTISGAQNNSLISLSSIESDFSLENAQVVSGTYFEVVLKTDGTVWTWGNNQYGQLGNGTTQNVNISDPLRVVGVNSEGYLERITQITAGAHFAAALTEDGKVVTWGYNAHGQLGNNTTTNSGVPVYVQDENGEIITGIKQISGGSSHMLALTEEGEVYSWGLNNYGQLGINTGNTTASNAEYKRIYAVKVQKKVTTTITAEDGTETTETHLENLDGITKVSGGTDFSLALKDDKTVVAWGLGTSGQLGTNSATTVYIPTAVYNLTDVKDIDAGGLQAIALKEDGSVWSWGINRYGNLGANIKASTSSSNANYKRIYPVKVVTAASTPITDVVEIASNYETSFALKSDGTVYGWGLNTSGQIGDYTTGNKILATIVKVAGNSAISKIKHLQDGQHTNVNMMIDENGYLLGSGLSSNLQMMSEHSINTYYAKRIGEGYLTLSNNQEYLEIGNSVNLTVGFNTGFNTENKKITLGEIEYRSSNTDIAIVDTAGKVTAISKGYVTIIAEDKENGYIAQSQINVVAKGATALPEVVAGTTFTAMLKEDGTVWTTGANGSGELGNGSSINTVNKPVQVKIDENTYLTDIRKIEVGTQHALALRKDGSVWAWGLNSSGQLGINSTTLSRYAVQVKDNTGEGYLEKVVDIATTTVGSSAVLSDGKVYAWGAGANNALGVNSTSNQILPVKVHDGYNVIQAQMGTTSILVLKGDGTVWGAGYNNVGQLADNSTAARTQLTPSLNNTKNGQLSGIMRIVTGAHHTVGLKEDGTAWIWGYNNTYQLGVNSTTNYLYPIALKNARKYCCNGKYF